VPLAALTRHKRPVDGADEFASLWHIISQGGD
jgi:hypothetical protein